MSRHRRSRRLAGVSTASRSLWTKRASATSISSGGQSVSSAAQSRKVERHHLDLVLREESAQPFVFQRLVGSLANTNGLPVMSRSAGEHDGSGVDTTYGLQLPPAKYAAQSSMSRRRRSNRSVRL